MQSRRFTKTGNYARHIYLVSNKALPISLDSMGYTVKLLLSSDFKNNCQENFCWKFDPLPSLFFLLSFHFFVFLNCKFFKAELPLIMLKYQLTGLSHFKFPDYIIKQTVPAIFIFSFLLQSNFQFLVMFKKISAGPSFPCNDIITVKYY